MTAGSSAVTSVPILFFFNEHPIKKDEGKRGPIKVDTVISAMKNEKVSIKV